MNLTKVPHFFFVFEFLIVASETLSGTTGGCRLCASVAKYLFVSFFLFICISNFWMRVYTFAIPGILAGRQLRTVGLRKDEYRILSTGHIKHPKGLWIHCRYALLERNRSTGLFSLREFRKGRLPHTHSSSSSFALILNYLRSCCRRQNKEKKEPMNLFPLPKDRQYQHELVIAPGLSPLASAAFTIKCILPAIRDLVAPHLSSGMRMGK